MAVDALARMQRMSPRDSATLVLEGASGGADRSRFDPDIWSTAAARTKHNEWPLYLGKRLSVLRPAARGPPGHRLKGWAGGPREPAARGGGACPRTVAPRRRRHPDRACLRRRTCSTTPLPRRCARVHVGSVCRLGRQSGDGTRQMCPHRSHRLQAGWIGLSIVSRRPRRPQCQQTVALSSRKPSVTPWRNRVYCTW